MKYPLSTFLKIYKKLILIDLYFKKSTNLGNITMTTTLPIAQFKTAKTLVFLDAEPQPLRRDIPNRLAGTPVIVRQANFSNVQAALDLLENLHEPPLAIVASYTLLRQHGFWLPKQIRQNVHLKNLPLIALATKQDWVDTARALREGIDDCYIEETNWKTIEIRIDFLRKYRPQLIAAAQIPEQLTVVKPLKVPLGKRIIDVTVASSLLVAASPILLLTAMLIRLESKGPVIYRSKRAGRNFEVFDFLKFRSMYPDADRRLRELQHLNQYSTNEGGVTFVKLKNDPRITRVGRFIRKFSIDELPQLINIIRGDMSLVGNRPLPLYEAKQLTKDTFAARFLAPAGLTGLWQVTKRGKDDMSVQERMNLDITYAKRYSLAMDLKIFFKTFGAFVQSENV